MTDLLTILILGVVEGITEFLPVSSTGHLILAGALLGYDEAHWKVFNVVIQLGAILAIVALYWRTFWTVIRGLIGRDPGAIRFVRNLVVASIPIAVIGLALHKQIEVLLGKPVVVAVALLVGGVAILLVERVAKPGTVKGIADIPLTTALAIGGIQCVAMVPGVSRSGATILGALLLGVERRTAAEFSFFLAIPAMLGASALEVFKNRHEVVAVGAVGPLAILIGSAVAFGVALVVVRWFIKIVGRHGFGPFAIYRIIAGSAALVWLLK